MMQRSELEQIYDEHARCAFALFQRFTRSHEDARELLQDWLVKIARGHDFLANIENQQAYLMRIAYRHAVDWTRRVAVRRKTRDAVCEEPTQPSFSPVFDPDGDMIRDSMERCLAELPHDQQVAVQLRLWDGLTFVEIGEVLDISTNTAASRTHGLAHTRRNMGSQQSLRMPRRL